MLELKGIVKNYLSGENTVHALKGIDIKFRRSELVSILGPSGCGKTTMLNIIGGLDGYTEGDLLINGVSTKKYKDRDWDTYRNHSVGFVFQSYNLIPHQTVLQNVEIALTLSGVSKSERRKRAIEALQNVGLGSQLNKRPSEMSGGQMQRVAIARAIVNDPDIILADEPTGALDTKTGEQVMDILKDIAKDRLVVMVTHNPELAEKYSTRIIRMLDGKITDDSRPLTDEEAAEEEKRQAELNAESVKKIKKPSMSFATSFSLSLKNLFTKKGRTALTSFAGSIGIIGIALIYAISQGFTYYIDDVQEETLSSYPLTIYETSTDLSSLMETFVNVRNGEADHEKDAVYKKSAIYEMIDALNNVERSENDLKAFKSFIETERSDGGELQNALSGVKYTYDLDLLVYTKNPDGTVIYSNAQELLRELIYSNLSTASSSVSASSLSSMSGLGSAQSSAASSRMVLWQEMLAGNDGKPVSPLIEKQYEVVYGSFPNSYDEIVLILDENNELSDMALYALGLESKEAVSEIMNAALNGEELTDQKNTRWSYEEICSKEYRVILNSDCFSLDESTGLYHDLRETDAGTTYLYDNALPLRVSGIIRPKEDAVSQMLTGSIGYTSDLTRYIIEKMQGSEVVSAQFDSPQTDVISGLPFKAENGSLSDEEKAEKFREYAAGMSDSDKAAAYTEIMSVPSDEQLAQMTQAALQNTDRQTMETAMTQMFTVQMNMSESEVSGYIASMDDEQITEIYIMAVQEQAKAQYAREVVSRLSAMSSAELAAGFDELIRNVDAATCSGYYDEIAEFSDSTYDDNLKAMGYVDIDKPSSINLYASTFENKDTIADAISDYNIGRDELEQINYTDYVGIIMSSVTTIINTITYVLIAFVGISLIVSSIMIGVITLISVQERTKEIGILRAIGASKRNVSNMFNAETVLIGFSSGLLGVAVTYLLCLPINALVYALTEISNLKAVLPIPAALVLILISILLTLIAGIIPSRSAAKKDPVVALRTE